MDICRSKEGKVNESNGNNNNNNNDKENMNTTVHFSKFQQNFVSNKKEFQRKHEFYFWLSLSQQSCVVCVYLVVKQHSAKYNLRWECLFFI